MKVSNLHVNFVGSEDGSEIYVIAHPHDWVSTIGIYRDGANMRYTADGEFDSNRSFQTIKAFDVLDYAKAYVMDMLAKRFEIRYKKGSYRLLFGDKGITDALRKLRPAYIAPAAYVVREIAADACGKYGAAGDYQWAVWSADGARKQVFTHEWQAQVLVDSWQTHAIACAEMQLPTPACVTFTCARHLPMSFVCGGCDKIIFVEAADNTGNSFVVDGSNRDWTITDDEVRCPQCACDDVAMTFTAGTPCESSDYVVVCAHRYRKFGRGKPLTVQLHLKGITFEGNRANWDGALTSAGDGVGVSGGAQVFKASQVDALCGLIAKIQIDCDDDRAQYNPVYRAMDKWQAATLEILSVGNADQRAIDYAKGNDMSMCEYRQMRFTGAASTYSDGSTSRDYLLQSKSSDTHATYTCAAVSGAGAYSEFVAVASGFHRGNKVRKTKLGDALNDCMDVASKKWKLLGLRYNDRYIRVWRIDYNAAGKEVGETCVYKYRQLRSGRFVMCVNSALHSCQLSI